MLFEWMLGAGCLCNSDTLLFFFASTSIAKQLRSSACASQQNAQKWKVIFKLLFGFCAQILGGVDIFGFSLEGFGFIRLKAMLWKTLIPLLSFQIRENVNGWIIILLGFSICISKILSFSWIFFAITVGMSVDSKVFFLVTVFPITVLDTWTIC